MHGLRFTEIGEEQLGASTEFRRELVRLQQHVVDAVRAEADAHAAHVLQAEDAGEIIVTAAAADAAGHGAFACFHFEDGTGVVVEAAGEGWIEFQRCDFNAPTASKVNEDPSSPCCAVEEDANHFSSFFGRCSLQVPFNRTRVQCP
jgi:hypothetical protein